MSKYCSGKYFTICVFPNFQTIAVIRLLLLLLPSVLFTVLRFESYSELGWIPQTLEDSVGMGSFTSHMSFLQSVASEHYAKLEKSF